MKNDIEEFIVFIMGFAIICVFFNIFMYVTEPLAVWLLSFNDGGIFYPMFLAFSFYLAVWIIQFIVPFVASIIIICRCKNKIFSKLYGSFWLPTLLFGLCLVADYLVNINFKGTEDDLRIYNLFTSLSKNFLPIYVIAMINLIRLKILQVKNKN